MYNIPTKHYGALARRLREDVGLGVRALASQLDVSFSAVARAERGDPSLQSLAEKAIVFLLSAATPSGQVADQDASYGSGSLELDDEARAHIRALIEEERGW